MEPLSREQLEELAVLYDRFAHGLDPFDPGSELAEKQFYNLLEHFHSTLAPRTRFDEFRREAVRVCKAFLRRNP